MDRPTGSIRERKFEMADESDNSIASRAAVAAGAAIGSAAVAATLMFVKRRKDRKSANALPPPTSTAPHFPPETD